MPGLYFFNHHVFEAFKGKNTIKPSTRGEYEITDLYNYLIENGYRVETKEIKGEWLDPGKFDDSLDANRLMLERNCKAEEDIIQKNRFKNKESTDTAWWW